MTGARATRRFIAINKMVLERLVELVERRRATYVTVPMQGTGTFAVEAMLDDLRAAGRQGAGADQRRLRPARQEDLRDRRPRRRRARDAGGYAARSRRGRALLLDADPAITHVFAVHCETTSGILNPIAEIARARAQSTAAELLVDSMSAFGALPLDVAQGPVRRDRGLVEQMHRGRAGPRLRHLPQDRAGRAQGQRHDAGARPPRPMGELREDRPVALHAADPCHRRLPSGARGVHEAEGGVAGRGERYRGELPAS